MKTDMRVFFAVFYSLTETAFYTQVEKFFGVKLFKMSAIPPIVNLLPDVL
jgi:hypothetical protein